MNLSNGDGRTQNILHREIFVITSKRGSPEEYTLNPQGLPVWKADNNKQRDICIMDKLTSRLSNTQ